MAKQIYWNRELYHIGVKGRSGRYPLGSGKRPYQHGPMSENHELIKDYLAKKDPYFPAKATMRPNGVIKKGSTLYRIAGANSEKQPKGYKHDPLSGDIKYVSTNQSDLVRWKDLLYGDKAKAAPTVIYNTKEDIKVMTAQEAGQKYSEIVNAHGKTAMKEVDKYFKDMNMNMEAIGAPKNTTVSDVFSNNSKLTKGQRNDLQMVLASNAIKQHGLGGNSKTGIELVKKIYDMKFSAVEDALGWNAAGDPIIVLNPRKKLKTEYDGPGTF